MKKQTIIAAFLSSVFIFGCTTNKQPSLTNTSFSEKDRLFESYFVKKLNEVNKLKNRAKIIERKSQNMKKNDIFYQQIHGGRQ